MSVYVDSREDDNEQRVDNLMAKVVSVLIVFLVAGIVIGGFYLSQFFIRLAHYYTGSGFFSTSNVLSWLIAVVVVLFGFGLLRYVTSFISQLFKFVFKFAQSDVVTVVLAIIMNVLYAVFDYWLTGSVIDLIGQAPVDSFFNTDNIFSYIVLFTMFAGAFIWIPRVGQYGENRIAAVLDEGNRW